MEHKCKHCNKPAKKNILKNGRNKGYNKTCGSEECLNKMYSDVGVIAQKAYVLKQIKTNCKCCNRIYIKTSPKQKWCKVCVPDDKFRSIMIRYDLSYPKFCDMINETNGICKICLKRPATNIDHDHKTGRIRGIICSHCNTSLNLIEDKPSLERAIRYINVY